MAYWCTHVLTDSATVVKYLSSRVDDNDIPAGDLVINIKTESRYARTADVIGSVTVPLQGIQDRAYESKRFELISWILCQLAMFSPDF